MNWSKNLIIPQNPPISRHAENLIRQLCCDAANRLGSQNGAHDIKVHPFFNGVDFRNLRKQRAPPAAIPKIAYPEDTSNFDTDEINTDDDDEDAEDTIHENDHNAGNSSRASNLDHNHQGFYEFTFRRFFDDGGYPLSSYNYESVEFGQPTKPGPRGSNSSPPPEPPERAPPVYV